MITFNEHNHCWFKEIEIDFIRRKILGKKLPNFREHPLTMGHEHLIITTKIS
jgi:hypothetical protein